MKQTSLLAYDESKKFKLSHHKRILAVMDVPMIASQIGKRCGLTTLQTLRRLLELELQGKILVCGTDGRYSIYTKLEVEWLESDYKKIAAEKKTKRVLKAFINDRGAMDILVKSCFIDVVCQISKGMEDHEIKEEIINNLKNHIK